MYEDVTESKVVDAFNDFFKREHMDKNFKMEYVKNKFQVTYIYKGKKSVHATKNPYKLCEEFMNYSYSEDLFSLTDNYCFYKKFASSEDNDYTVNNKVVINDTFEPDGNYVGVAIDKIVNHRDIVEGYQVILKKPGNTREAADSEVWKKLRVDRIKELINSKKVYFVNLQIDKAGRLIKKAIDPRVIPMILKEEFSNTAIAIHIKYAHDNKEEAYKVIKQHYLDNKDHYRENGLLGLLESDIKWMKGIVDTGIVDRFYYYDTSARDKFSKLLKRKLFKNDEIIPYWQLH